MSGLTEKDVLHLYHNYDVRVTRIDRIYRLKIGEKGETLYIPDYYGLMDVLEICGLAA